MEHFPGESTTFLSLGVLQVEPRCIVVKSLKSLELSIVFNLICDSHFAVHNEKVISADGLVVIV